MGLLDVHADGIRQAFDFSLRAPVPDEPPASFNAASFAGAGFKALGRAGLETAANFADLGAALQQGDINALPAATLTDAQRAARLEEHQRLKGQFQDFGASMRLRSAELAPDPLTAHRADQVMSGVGTSVVRAAGAIATTGPVGGSVIFGAGEGDTTYHEAIDRGIDPATAAKLAATTGVISGLTAGVPAVGSTVARTLGIAAAAGPGSYVAQEFISRKILQSAGLPDEAAMHDPTDPLGLALSIALPGVAAGLHIRGLAKQKSLADVKVAIESGGKRFGADGQLLESPAGALGEHQVLPSTAADPGFGIPPAKPLPNGKPDPDELARVGTQLFASHLEHFDGDGAKALAAYNAGRGAVDAAITKHGDDWLAHMPDETRAYVEKGMKQFGDHAVARAAADPDTVDAARVRVTNAALLEHLPDHPDAFIELQRATDAVSQGPVHETLPEPERVRLEGEQADVERQRADLLPAAANLAEPGEIRQIRQQLAELQARPPEASMPADIARDHQAQIDSLKAAIERDTSAQQAHQQLSALDQQHADLTQRLQSTPLTTVRPAAPRAAALAVREAMQPGQGVPKAVEPAPDLFRPRIPGTREAQPKFEKAPPKAEAPGAEPKPAGERPAMVKAEPESLEVQRAEALIADNPDLRVQLPGGTETVGAADALARVKSEAKHDAGAAELIRAAVQCALSFGD